MTIGSCAELGSRESRCIGTQLMCPIKGLYMKDLMFIRHVTVASTSVITELLLFEGK